MRGMRQGHRYRGGEEHTQSKWRYTHLLRDAWVTPSGDPEREGVGWLLEGEHAAEAVCVGAVTDLRDKLKSD